jgi:hypothetical protein
MFSLKLEVGGEKRTGAGAGHGLWLCYVAAVMRTAMLMRAVSPGTPGSETMIHIEWLTDFGLYKARTGHSLRPRVDVIVHSRRRLPCAVMAR